MLLPKATTTRTGHSMATKDGYMAWDRPTSPEWRSAAVLAEDSSTLYAIPNSVSPIYRTLPVVFRAATASLSVLIGIFTTWSRVAVLSAWHSAGRLPWNSVALWKDLIVCAVKSIFLYTVATGLLQELPAYRPGRIATQTLADHYHLPTKLSNYRAVKGVAAIGNVHWLQAEMSNAAIPGRFACAHFNHGFGASSLSWLPSLPLVVDRLGIPRAVAHDAPGFGFTDRSSSYIDDYSCDRSAEIGVALLRPLTNSTVLLVGHSLGAYTTLQMALAMEESVKLRIILVSPAFGLGRRSGSRVSKRRTRQGIWSSAVDSVAGYVLRRIVGSPGFIRRGLQIAWANPLKANDVLRFQWPSIVRGWERGLLRFARAPLPSDERLLRRVLALPNVEAIDVVVGEQDQIVKLPAIRKFLAAFPTIPLSTIANCGHDPFEENEAAFVEHISGLLISS